MKALWQAMTLLALSSCSVTSHPAQLVEIGVPSSVGLIKPTLNQNGPIQFKKVVAADWAVSRAGLINLEDPKARSAGLQKGDEEIQIYFYVVDHPQYGRYLIDSGVENNMKTAPEKTPLGGGILASFMNMEKLVIHQTTREWQLSNPQEIKGVFLTHMHLDHIMGIPDIKPTVPIFIGPDESTHKLFLYMFSRSATDDYLEGPRTLSELHFSGEVSAKSPRVIDFFGDKSLFVIAMPGHTAGSMAFVIRSSNGTHIVTGDTCHTRWGWDNDVTPGDFSEDLKGNQESLDFLKDLAQSAPGIKVHLGHQSIVPNNGKLEPH